MPTMPIGVPAPTKRTRITEIDNCPRSNMQTEPDRDPQRTFRQFSSRFLHLDFWIWDFKARYVRFVSCGINLLPIGSDIFKYRHTLPPPPRPRRPTRARARLTPSGQAYRLPACSEDIASTAVGIRLDGFESETELTCSHRNLPILVAARV